MPINSDEAKESDDGCLSECRWNQRRRGHKMRRWGRRQRRDASNRTKFLAFFCLFCLMKNFIVVYTKGVIDHWCNFLIFQSHGFTMCLCFILFFFLLKDNFIKPNNKQIIKEKQLPHTEGKGRLKTRAQTKQEGRA